MYSDSDNYIFELSVELLEHIKPFLTKNHKNRTLKKVVESEMVETQTIILIEQPLKFHIFTIETRSLSQPSLSKEQKSYENIPNFKSSTSSLQIFEVFTSEIYLRVYSNSDNYISELRVELLEHVKLFPTKNLEYRILKKVVE